MNSAASRPRTLSFGEWDLIAIGIVTVVLLITGDLGAPGLFAVEPGG